MERVKKAAKKIVNKAKNSSAAKKYKEAVNKFAKRLPGPNVPPAGVIQSPTQRYKCGGHLKK